jgi:hypothetical protein
MMRWYDVDISFGS